MVNEICNEDGKKFFLYLLFRKELQIENGMELVYPLLFVPLEWGERRGAEIASVLRLTSTYISNLNTIHISANYRN